ncbi:MAG: MFS transporter [Dehalococcoidia bacterium]|nr:MFS transporter [Dehalococcoidia bacterium]
MANVSPRLSPPGGPPRSTKPSFRAALTVFEYRHYRYLWVSSAFSFTGMQMQQIARALLAWELTKSFGAVGAISLSFGLPMMLFSLIGGSLADRLDKRNLTLMTQVSTAILATFTAVLVATDTITIEMLFAIGLVQGTFFAFGMPARTPLMAEVVGPDNVMSAIAMSNAAMNATRLFGPAVAGVLVAIWGSRPRTSCRARSTCSRRRYCCGCPPA